MSYWTKALITALSLFLVVGCSFAPKAPTKDRPYSGFMENYRPLSPLETKNLGLVSSKSWVSPKVNLSHYSSVLITPVTLGHGIQRDSQITSSGLAKIRNYTENALFDRLSGYYLISNQEGPDTLQVRVAITGLETHDESFRAYEYLPIGIVATLGSKIIGVRDEEVNMFVEAEFIDTDSGLVVAKSISAMVAPERLENKWQAVTLKVIKPALDQWLNQQVANLTIAVPDTTLVASKTSDKAVDTTN